MKYVFLLFLLVASLLATAASTNPVVAGALSVPVVNAPAQNAGPLYSKHCASCHGTTGRGNGPLSEHLRRTPPNLTQFTRRNGGVFPAASVYRILEGGDIASHGNREMPVWGDVFKIGHSPSEVKARIDAIVRYLAGIQERGV